MWHEKFAPKAESTEESQARHKLEYNGGFSNFKTLLHIRNTTNVIQILHSRS